MSSTEFPFDAPTGDPPALPAEPDGYVPLPTPGGVALTDGTLWALDHPDPESVRHVSGLVRRRIAELVATRAGRLRSQRQELCGDRPPNVADVSAELRYLADTRDVLDVIGRTVHAARDDADAILADVVIDTGRRSARTGDGYGGDVKVTLETPRDTVCKLDEVVKVIRGALAIAYDRIDGVCPRCQETTHDPQCRDAYLAGVEDGIAKLREVLVSSPGVRTSALDAMVRELATLEPGGAVLASTLSRAYARIDRPGAPDRVKVEHVEPAKPRGARAEAPA